MPSTVNPGARRRTSSFSATQRSMPTTLQPEELFRSRGRAASFGTVLLMAGAKGRRYALPSASIHLHQPLITGEGITGQASDLAIHAEEIQRIKDELNNLIVNHTGQPKERVERDTDRDYFLTPNEAIEYGLIDGII